MRKKYLSLEEKWAIDVEITRAGCEAIKVLTSQCEVCQYRIKGKAEQCEQFENKPRFVRFCEKECPRFKHINSMKIVSENSNDEQIYGGFFGFCVGDALGVPVEFTSRIERKKDPVQEMRAYGTHSQAMGTWSDDSSLTFCLIESLIKGYDISDIAHIFCKYYDEAYWTPYNEIFDIGNTTVEAIGKMKRGIKPTECGGKTEKDNGNGSLMRILPLAFFLKGYSPDQRIKMVEEVSSLTHAHKRSKLACIMYVEYVMNLLDKKNKQDALTEMISFIKQYCMNEYYDEMKNYDRILSKSILSLEENEIRSSGYVVDTLEAALWAFLMTDSYQNTVFKCINLGDDTDTVAAIAGGLAGVFYGIQQIPTNWIQCLAKKEEIYALLKEFNKTLF